VDYPDIAGRGGLAVARGEADAGIVIDGAGIGSAIAANKIRGVRAAMCPDETIARYAREHNGANVLTLGSTLLDTTRRWHRRRVARTTPMTRGALHPAAAEDPPPRTGVLG
jgi:ribose 5-phosphate isomerase B